jgi:hypothetical protein
MAPVGGPSVGFILQPIRAGIDRFNTLSLELRIFVVPLVVDQLADLGALAGRSGA